MWETFALLLTGHLLGDFLFQTAWMVQHKQKPAVLLIHVSVVVLITAVLLGSLHWPILLLIYGSHLAMDAIKTWVLSDELKPFLFDQFVHIAVVFGLAIAYPEAAAQSLWLKLIAAEYHNLFYAALAATGSLVLAITAGGYLIGTMLKPLVNELEEEELQGLKRGGQYIGWLERALVVLFVYTGQPTGVGFVLGAKSILRFGDISNAKERRVAEYIIIGTFLSFGWALLIANVSVYVIGHWL
ncbi:MAG: DUF3307 domain-containing protein [Granulosicoccaceae bacterium]